MTEETERTMLSLRNYDGPYRKSEDRFGVYAIVICFLGFPTIAGLCAFAEWSHRVTGLLGPVDFLALVAAAVVVAALVPRAVRKVSYTSFTRYVNDGYGWDWSDVPEEEPLDGEYSVHWRRGGERGFGTMVISDDSLNVRRRNGDLLDVQAHAPSRRGEYDKNTAMYRQALMLVLFFLVGFAVSLFLKYLRIYSQTDWSSTFFLLCFVGVGLSVRFFGFSDD